MRKAILHMDILKFQNETSERSEPQNWVNKELSSSELFHYASFEGCNENSSNLVTTIMDRAVIEVSGDLSALPSEINVLERIKEKEGRAFIGKINFCRLLGLPYTYILYSYNPVFVLRYEVNKDICTFMERYSTFADFSKWIMKIKGWKSTKKYEENKDLPLFDKLLRKAGCAWPTNIDSVAYNNDNRPVAIIEFQNSKLIKVSKHFNNYYYLRHRDRDNNITSQGADEQRWRSQEILRLQSLLPHFTIVWSQNEKVIIIKKLHGVAFPDYDVDNEQDKYGEELTVFAESLKSNPKLWRNKNYELIRKQYSSYRLRYESGFMKTEKNPSPLSFDDMTFPFLYGKRIVTLKKDHISSYLDNLLKSLE